MPCKLEFAPSFRYLLPRSNITYRLSYCYIISTMQCILFRDRDRDGQTDNHYVRAPVCSIAPKIRRQGTIRHSSYSCSTVLRVQMLSVFKEEIWRDGLSLVSSAPLHSQSIIIWLLLRLEISLSCLRVLDQGYVITTEKLKLRRKRSSSPNNPNTTPVVW